jgi:ABC-type transport system involved in cytochrome bd biosynthesis fused ATPase/permease subunit
VVALRRRRIRSAQRVSRDADAALAGEATEVLRNVRVVQAFTREGEAGASFAGRSRGAVRAALAAMDLEARWSPVADLLLAAGGALVLWLGVTAVTGGRMTLGTLLVVLAYLSSLYGPIRALARLARTLARGAASRERILEVLDSGEVVPEAADPVPAGRPRHGLALRGVWFAYTEGAPVLRHLDLEVAALLQRFYDPDAGAIELDRVDLRDLELGSLRRQLALVPQDPWMLDGTIADNVGFGRSWGGSGGRTPPGMDQGPPRDEQLAAVATLAGLDEIIARLPDGWNTQIGEGGVRLSGGQRRRVALARAILRDASVLLQDEPTSGLDAASEHAVLDALDRAAEGRTVLAVSHRLSLAARVDRVVVLDGGRVVEQGPPGELLAAGGAYARLWALQHPQEPAVTGRYRPCGGVRPPGAPAQPRNERSDVEHEPSWNWPPGHELAPGLLAWALLGDGRRCETWLAWDVGRWCPVAVKLPRPGGATRAVLALAREAQVAGPTAHPGIRRLLEGRLEQPLPHLVFEYVEGPTLDDALADEGPFHPIDVLLTGMQLAAALGHLHGRGLAHLDVKPGNVVLRDGRPVLFELTTGTQAFDPADDGPPERRWPQLAGPPPSASSRNPEVPAAVDRAVATLLAPDPADRPVTAAQVLALLAGALPADAGEEARPWPEWATGRLPGWSASAMERPPPVPRPA